MIQDQTKRSLALSPTIVPCLKHLLKSLHCHATPSSTCCPFSLFLAIAVLISAFLTIPCTSIVYAAAPAWYSEYYMPGDEDSMMYILDTLGTGDLTTDDMHAEITVTAWSDNTTVYYDHWEDGYDFDPDDTSTADKKEIQFEYT